MSSYQPPYTITPAILNKVAEISEMIGRLSVSQGELSPQLRRGNRIRTIQSSLAIENNTLTVEQVTAVLDGKRVLGLPIEIQEVRNAFTVYEQLAQWQAYKTQDLLNAHAGLMQGLSDEAGQFRRGGVGIYNAEQLVHMAPPANKVTQLMKDLCYWLKNTDVHLLIAGCVFHYELEFIHPFSDGNGRMGRLWQSLILYHWQPLFAYLPVETIIKDKQQDYYAVLRHCDQEAESTLFIEFMLDALLIAIQEANDNDQDTVQVSDQVKALLTLLKNSPCSAKKLREKLNLKHPQSFRDHYLTPAMMAGFIEMTLPDKPKSKLQQYRLTKKGLALINNLMEY